MLLTNIKTTSELMSIALQAEREAILKYAQLAEKMREGNNGPAAALFERMVSEETEHERLLLEWMRQENIEEDPDIGPIQWREPHISNHYNEDARDPLHSSPYKALAFAVHNEEIAFRFYTHVAADSENETVRQYAEVLAREELGHAALLRAERRRAYHAERETSMAEPMLDPRVIQNDSDLVDAAIQIDRYLLNEMQQLANDAYDINLLSDATREQIQYHESLLQKQKKAETTENNVKIKPDSAGTYISQNLEQIKQYRAQMEKTTKVPDTALQRLCACCDRSFSFYDAIVETTEDEAVLLKAQQLTATALDRIGALKEILGNAYSSKN